MRKTKVTILTAIAVFTFIFGQAPETDSYFESGFDGVWSGFFSMGAGKQKSNLPVLLNINVQGKSGLGYVMTYSEEVKPGQAGFLFFKLTKVVVKGKKLTLEFKDDDGNAFKITLRDKKGVLKGKFTSDDPETPRGGVELVQMDQNKPVQGIWQGSVRIPGGKSFVSMQLTQSSPVSGTMVIGALPLKIEKGDFTGNHLSIELEETPDGELLGFELNLNKNKLKGTFTINEGSTLVSKSKTTFTPAGTKGKSISVTGVNPSEITIQQATPVSPTVAAQITIKGKNFVEGAVVHLDNPNILITGISFKSKKEIKVDIDIPSSTADGTKVGVRVVNPDNQQADKANAITIRVEDNGGGGGTTVSFANDIQPVFDDRCIGCHGLGGNASMDVRASVSYNNIVNVTSTQNPSLNRITPFDPDNSYLIRKIKGENISGQRMPAGGPFLDDATIAKFVTWVTEGAQNN